MSTKTNHWIFLLGTFLFVLLLAILSLPAVVSAAPSPGSTSNSCLTCHEDLYYLHDMGSHYCITDHKDRCINCHEGNKAETIEEQAHFGMILHPQNNEGAKCQECHAADAPAMIDSFAAGSGGFATVIKAEAYVPSAEAESGFPSTTEESQFVKNGVWAAGAVVLFGFWLALVLLSPQKP